MRRQRAITTGRSGDNGQGIAEYVLVLALIAVVSVLALLVVSGTAESILSSVGAGVVRPVPTAIVSPAHFRLVCVETSSDPQTLDCTTPSGSPAPGSSGAPAGSVSPSAAASSARRSLDCAVVADDPLKVVCDGATPSP